jgi:hypothetical protein
VFWDDPRGMRHPSGDPSFRCSVRRDREDQSMSDLIPMHSGTARPSPSPNSTIQRFVSGR